MTIIKWKLDMIEQDRPTDMVEVLEVLQKMLVTGSCPFTTNSSELMLQFWQIPRKSYFDGIKIIKMQN